MGNETGCAWRLETLGPISPNIQGADSDSPALMAVVCGFLLPALLLLQSVGFVVEAHEFRFPEACGIFQDQGLNPSPTHWQLDS